MQLKVRDDSGWEISSVGFTATLSGRRNKLLTVPMSENSPELLIVPRNLESRFVEMRGNLNDGSAC